jgi:hypothetical protein
MLIWPCNGFLVKEEPTSGPSTFCSSHSQEYPANRSVLRPSAPNADQLVCQPGGFLCVGIFLWEYTNDGSDKELVKYHPFKKWKKTENFGFNSFLLLFSAELFPRPSPGPPVVSRGAHSAGDLHLPLRAVVLAGRTLQKKGGAPAGLRRLNSCPRDVDLCPAPPCPSHSLPPTAKVRGGPTAPFGPQGPAGKPASLWNTPWPGLDRRRACDCA